VAGAGVAVEAGMDATVTGVGMTTAGGTTSAGATAAECDAGGGPVGADDGGGAGFGGYGADRQGWGSRLSLVIFSSSKALRASRSAMAATEPRIQTLNSSGVIGMVAQGKKGGWAGRTTCTRSMALIPRC
jgi:hypothetical protein